MLAHFPFEYEDEQLVFRGKAGVFRRHSDGRTEAQLLDGELFKTK